jgi:hypothetical protein
MPTIAKSSMSEAIQAGVTKPARGQEQAGFGGVFKVTCVDAEGNLKWEDEFHNLVVNEGLQDLNTKYFKGATYTAAWFLGLVTGPGSGTTFAAGDTLATHAGWTEYTAYSGTRKAVTFGTATLADPSVISNSGSSSQFVITAPGGTIGGAFLCSVTSGTSGILFSAGDFTGGDKIVAATDTINVTYTFSADAV